MFGEVELGITAQPNYDPQDSPTLSFDKSVTKLQEENILSLFKKDVVFAIIDNQRHNSHYFIYPYAMVELETLSPTLLRGEDWLLLCEQIVESLELELAIVLRTPEKMPGWGTPLGIGIGLSRVFWIMCLGTDYAKLLRRPSHSTTFFKRIENPRTGCSAFMSAPTYSEFLSIPSELVRAQRKEIGDQLFHRLPEEEQCQGGAEVSWIFSPKNLFRFALFLYREKMTNWRKYQADVVPQYYKESYRREHPNG